MKIMREVEGKSHQVIVSYWNYELQGKRYIAALMLQSIPSGKCIRGCCMASKAEQDLTFCWTTMIFLMESSVSAHCKQRGAFNMFSHCAYLKMALSSSIYNAELQ